MPNRRVPDAKKKLKGTDKPYRMNKDAPQPDQSTPRKPGASMSPRELEFFDEVVGWLRGQHVDYRDHGGKVWLAARLMALIEELDRVIAEEGRFVRAVKLDDDGEAVAWGEPKPHPAQLRLEKAEAQLRMLLGDFGLDPVNMSKSTAHKAVKKEKSDLDALLEEIEADEAEAAN